MIIKIVKMSIGHYRYTTLYLKSDVEILWTVMYFLRFLVFHYMFRPHMGHHQVSLFSVETTALYLFSVLHSCTSKFSSC
jgi:hypothetical protein